MKGEGEGGVRHLRDVGFIKICKIVAKIHVLVIPITFLRSKAPHLKFSSMLKQNKSNLGVESN